MLNTLSVTTTPANQQGNADTDDRDDGHGGIFQRVLHQEGAVAGTLGAGSADVILRQNLHHAGPCHPSDQRHVDEAERQSGQGDGCQEWTDAVANWLVALHREPAQIEGEKSTSEYRR